MADVPAGFAELQGAELRRAFRALLRIRMAMFPIIVGFLLWYWRANGGSRLRLILICAFLASAASFIAFLFWQERHKVDSRAAGIGLVGSTVALVIGTALSGGLDSPFLILVPALGAGATFGTDRRHGWMSAAILLAGVLLVGLPDGSESLFTVATACFGVVVGVTIGFTLRDMFDRMLLRALHARDDLLRMHSEQLQALTTFSSEIAHELKTPLASIKGLTGLALMELGEPLRAAERLEVLRSEALRMQRLLDEFLDFSRPLAPLTLAPADGLAIAEEVIDLFQGLARERQLALRLTGASIEARCDARKIKQVLINLVQNAVEASSAGGQVVVEVESSGASAIFRVLDRGHGLSGRLAEKVFQAGVTTKARGSGLGLTIARSIARQHGGTLELAARDGGGCVATLVIPCDAAASAEGRAA